MLKALLLNNLRFRVGGTYTAGNLTLYETYKPLCFSEFNQSATKYRIKQVFKAHWRAQETIWRLVDGNTFENLHFRVARTYISGKFTLDET